ncbi:MAG TPA: L-seryl-tRNA(Sec) selenium transferase [Terriglobia bacterium]|nr:L-seryl-tRNA(Sec) selenium transferase [Terriglobia bacterium]
MPLPQQDLLRSIPSVDKLLEEPAVLNLVRQTSRPFVVKLLRKVLLSFRQSLNAGIVKDSQPISPLEGILREFQNEFERSTNPQLINVINATGVLLHTNFGRAPLGKKSLQHLTAVASGYSNLEFDLEKGTRGRRDVFADRLLKELLGCEQALVVNNCAAALFLALNTLAEGAEVIISRGELIEIGDSFRIPDILRKSGAVLREVGTTNRTRLADYAGAISERTRLILRVHPSNFRIVGFSSRPALEELIALAKERGLPLLEDVGGGCLVDLQSFGIEDEPKPRDSLNSGVSLVCFSGDKLLGGPQAGILAGTQDLVDRIRGNPLFRALRVDKLTLSVLESTLISHLSETAPEDIPLMQMLHRPTANIDARAQAIANQLKLPHSVDLQIIDGHSMIGGGCTPDHVIPTRLLAFSGSDLSLSKLEARLRTGSPPIACRLENDCLLLDLRTVFPQDDEHVCDALQELFAVANQVKNAM